MDKIFGWIIGAMLIVMVVPVILLWLGLGLLFVISTYWYVVIPVVAGGIAIYLAYKVQKANRTAAEAKRHQDQEFVAGQDRLRMNLEQCVSSAEVALKDIRKSVTEADRALEVAKREFADRAFAPFWEAVERAVNSLARTDAGINSVIKSSKTYAKQVGDLASPPPPFRADIDTLPDTTRVASKLSSVVRAAQKDFQFTMIYNQIRTNSILIAGFTNLGDALSGIGDRLEASIGGLADAISEVNEGNRSNSEAVVSSVANVREAMEVDANASRDHEAKLREMLDNIQRGRKPRSVHPKTFD